MRSACKQGVAVKGQASTEGGQRTTSGGQRVAGQEAGASQLLHMHLGMPHLPPSLSGWESHAPPPCLLVFRWWWWWCVKVAVYLESSHTGSLLRLMSRNDRNSPVKERRGHGSVLHAGRKAEGLFSCHLFSILQHSWEG